MRSPIMTVNLVILAMTHLIAADWPVFPFDIDGDITQATNDIGIGKPSIFFQNNPSKWTASDVARAYNPQGSNDSLLVISKMQMPARSRPVLQRGQTENPFAAWMNFPSADQSHTASISQSSHGDFSGFASGQSGGTEGSTDTHSVSLGILGNGYTSGRADSTGNNGSAIGVGSSGGGSDCHAETKATASTGKGEGSSAGTSSSMCSDKHKLLISLAYAGSINFEDPTVGTDGSLSFSHGDTSTMSFDVPGAWEFLGPVKKTFTETKATGSGLATAHGVAQLTSAPSTTTEPNFLVAPATEVPKVTTLHTPTVAPPGIHHSQKLIPEAQNVIPQPHKLTLQAHQSPSPWSSLWGPTDFNLPTKTSLRTGNKAGDNDGISDVEASAFFQSFFQSRRR